MHSEGPEPHSLFWMGRAPPDADSVCELQSVVVAARACVAPSAASNTAARAVANAVPAVMRRFGSAMLVPFPLGPAPGPGGRRAPSGPSALVAGSVAVTLTRHLTRSIAGSRTRDRQQVSAAAPELLRESFSICSEIFQLAMIGKDRRNRGLPRVTI